MLGSDIVAEKLWQAGCRHAFGIPGGEVLALMGSLSARGMNFVLTKHENPAGFMAEGAWHADGAPGILLATIGPGVANAVNVIANAEQDRVPLIFLTGRVDPAEAESYTHQVFDHAAMLRPIVKASFTPTPESIGLVMDKAVAIAMAEPAGPVHIDVPISVAEGEAVTPPDLGVPARPRPGLPAEADLAAFAERLTEAKRPLAIAGVDAVNEAAGPAIARFCARYKVPLITSYKGKGLIDETAPLALGGAGLSPKADSHIMPLIREADLILLLGYDPIEMRIGWRNPWPHDKPVVEIAPVPRTHGMHSVSLPLLGAVAATLEAVSARAEPQETWPKREWAKTKKSLARAFAPEEGWGPGRVFATLRAVMPENTVATADSGAHRILLSQMWPCRSPRGLLQSSALCTMGCALPLAMGHYLADAEKKPVIVFVGDAGLEMIMGELATLRDLKLPVIVCVLVDESLALIVLKQRKSQRANVGVDFGATDFVGLAQVMGGHGVWIDDSRTLEAEATAALGRETFTLLACRIGRRAYDGTF